MSPRCWTATRQIVRLNCGFTLFLWEPKYLEISIKAKKEKKKTIKTLSSNYSQPQTLTLLPSQPPTVSLRLCQYGSRSPGRSPVTPVALQRAAGRGGWVGFPASLWKAPVEAAGFSPVCFSALAPREPKPTSLPTGKVCTRKFSRWPWQHGLPLNLHNV